MFAWAVRFQPGLNCCLHYQTHFCAYFEEEVAFSALTLLDGCREEHAASKNSVMRRWQGFLFNATARGAGFHNVPVPLPWPSQNPIAFCIIKAQNGFTFMVLAYPGFPRKISLNRCLFVLKLYCYCLQCFDAVGWAAGSASGL